MYFLIGFEILSIMDLHYIMNLLATIYSGMYNLL